MTLSTANFLMGPCTIYAGALGSITAPPTDALVNATPAASAWTNLGDTNGGSTVSWDPKFTALMSDQIVYTVDERLTSVDVLVTSTLAEMTLSNFAAALNTTIGTTGAGFATFEPNYGPNATQTPKISLLLDGFAPNPAGGVSTFRRRLYIPRSQQTGKVSVVAAKDKQQGFDVQFAAYFVSNTVAPFHWTDQTS
jgi:hypothetical protein